jgi:hypothetical protein|tara:strand:+ start:758 stop:1141 length:384 start_codon:yes stop_codon:yes gene_type:complete
MAETKTPVSNLGVSAQSKTQSMVQFLSGLEQDRTEINGGQYDAAIAFFRNKGYDVQASESIAYVLMKQAKVDNANVFSVLDTLKGATDLELSQLVAEILNAYRYKTSVLGYKNDRSTQSHITRNIKA